ncbi:MAG: hypothetical protein U1E59_07495 [Amaricoccus sp.]
MGVGVVADSELTRSSFPRPRFTMAGSSPWQRRKVELMLISTSRQVTVERHVKECAPDRDPGVQDESTSTARPPTASITACAPSAWRDPIAPPKSPPLQPNSVQSHTLSDSTAGDDIEAIHCKEPHELQPNPGGAAGNKRKGFMIFIIHVQGTPWQQALKGVVGKRLRRMPSSDASAHTAFNTARPVSTPALSTEVRRRPLVEDRAPSKQTYAGAFLSRQQLVSARRVSPQWQQSPLSARKAQARPPRREAASGASPT